MRIFNWVQEKLNNNGMVSHKRGISVANEIVDTRMLVDSVNLEGLDDILAIGTFGFDQSNPFISETEEEIADSESLVVECCQETEGGQETNMSISKPTIDTFVATANEVCLVDKEMLDENDDDEKKNKMTLSDLFLADDRFFRNPDNNVGNITADVKKPSDCSDNCEERVKTVHTSTPPSASAALVQTKDKKPSCSFIQKLPLPCMTAGKDSSCFLYPRLPTRKLHQMMAKMLKKKKKIHPAAAQHDGEIADTESKTVKVFLCLGSFGLCITTSQLEIVKKISCSLSQWFVKTKNQRRLFDRLVVQEMKIHSYEDLLKHNQNRDCWLLISGKVYDVTEFMEDHPGGDQVLLTAAGKDATDDFEDVGHSESAREMLVKYYIGEIDSSTIPAKRQYIPAEQQTKAATGTLDTTSSFGTKILQFLVPLLIVALAFGIREYTKKLD
ncbi:hypothetical protein MKW92_029492 [Papaver armeniacum]|nr:hypothetical protein MKW92_029492 [Papaver armeniacum]